jgi:hypothetical protein
MEEINQTNAKWYNVNDEFQIIFNKKGHSASFDWTDIEGSYYYIFYYKYHSKKIQRILDIIDASPYFKYEITNDNEYGEKKLKVYNINMQIIGN